MDVMLEVADEARADSIQRHRWPCHLDLGATTSGAEVAEWLDDHLRRAGIDAGGGGRWWTTTGHDVGALPLATSALAPGDTLVRSTTVPPSQEIAVDVALDSGATTDTLRRISVGVHRLGGSPEDDVTVPGCGLPAGAAIIEVHPDGAVDVRRRAGVDGGDDDPFFGSPTDGRSIRFAAAELSGAQGARCRVGPVDLVFRHSRHGDGSGRRQRAVNRTPYRPVPEGPRELAALPAPPTAPRASRVAITTLVVPLATGLGMALLLGRPHFLLIVLLAPVALGVVHLVDRRRGRRTFATERGEYRERIAARVEDALAAAGTARTDAHRALPSAERCVDAALAGQPTLWQRAAGGPHLLRARVGTYDGPAVVSVPVDAGGDDGLRAEAEQELATACRPPGPVPADVDLDRAVAVGVCGPQHLVSGVVRALVAQFATHHGPEDIVLAAAVSPGAAATLDGLSWLPHTRSDSSPLAGSHIALWEDDIDRLVGELVSIAAARGSTGSGAPGRRRVPRLVLFVDQSAAVDAGALGQLLDLAPDAGIRVVWFGADPALVPRQCRVTVHVAERAAATRIESTDTAEPTIACTAESLSRDSLRSLGRALAGCHDVASPGRTGALPAQVTLFDVVPGNHEAMQLDVWRSSDGSSLAAPVGLGGSGPVVLDLVEHGPHALVAGTSGSGKSELLQTWVTSMAAQHPPSRCTFLFIDYKGGATAEPLLELPHTVGSVTNLDPRLSQRALVSLRAELDRRMALLSGRAKDLAEFAAIAPDECPPRLVIVVDEFATLVKEIPAFITGVVDVAQRGRSLGIHVILATQRPSGVVNDDILANTSLRLALRVVDAADSRSVIGIDDAATIPTGLRGRAYARLGPGSITGLQVAWATAPTDDVGPRAHVIRRCPTAVPPGQDAPAAVGTQLAAVAQRLAAAHLASGGPRPRRPWVPPLPTVVTMDELVAARDDAPSADDPGRVVTIGLADDPAHQRRRVATVDLEATGGLATFGAGGTGRTTVLRSAVVSAVADAPVGRVQVVVLDFAGRALPALLELPHGRAVVTGDDVEAAAREIEWLAAEIDRRRDLLRQTRAEAWSALTDRADRPPRILLVIDGFAALRAALDTAAGHPWWEHLQRILVDGRQVGIHALVSADRRNDLPAATLGALGSRLVLRMSEPEAMSALGVPRAVARDADLPVGRGFLGDREVQVFVLDGGDDGPSGAGESAALARLGARCRDAPAPRVPGLPRTFSEWPPDVNAEVEADRRAVPIGIDERGEIVTVDLDGPTIVVGPRGSGRSNLLAEVLAGAGALQRAGALDRIVVAADDRSPLSAWKAPPYAVVVSDPDEVAATVDAGAVDGARQLVVVDDAERLDGTPAGAAIVAWLERDLPCVLAADRAVLVRSLSGLPGLLRRVRPMVVLQPDGGSDVEALIGQRVRFRPGTSFPVGRALVCDRRHLVHVQLKNSEID